jgi:phospholipase C
MNPDIQHVVVLMLENRSFDSMLGRVYPASTAFQGLSLNESNSSGMTYGVWTDPNITPAIACIPDPDPGEAFIDMNFQLFQTQTRPADATTATMKGFAENYAHPSDGKGYRDPGAVMHYFAPDQVPVISTLARAFGVCDQWHASAPCQTWPNRFFAHTGTALGYVDNNTFRIPFTAPSIFGRMESLGKTWRVYFHDMPQSILLRDVWLHALTHYRLFNQFLADAHTGSLPNYSFIEPRYFTDLFSNLIPNDEHPPHNVLYGEQLIAQVYNAVRASPCWKQTLLIITYDEHGGCYDHIVPPLATPPDDAVNNPHGFNFNAYGVRVPAVIISPYVPPGSVLRPIQNPGAGPTPFDHTAIIKTLREIFSLGDKLTDRDDVAPSLIPALSLAAPNNDGPASVAAALASPPVSQLTTRGAAAPNGMQAALAAAAATLPQSAPQTEAEIPDDKTPDRSSYATVAQAQAAAVANLQRFLQI